MRLNLLLAGLTLLTGCVSKLDDLGSRTEPVHDAALDGGNTDDGDGEAGPVDTCANAALDEGETAIDCGGEKCRPCGLGLQCSVDNDCNSEVCSANVCRSATCRNDALDGDETDKDCGGSCVPCADGLHCSVGAHCQSRVCTANGFCETAKCDDEVKNGEETSEDCGGGTCKKCGDGASCEIARDCETDFCVENADQTEKTCASPDCGDDAQNGSETDKDCGGSCPGCAPGLHCDGDADCLSLVCASTDGVGLCQAPLCDDTTQNQGEAAIDCGGPCAGCPAGTPCSKPEDCADLVCKAGEVDAEPTCAAATCGDEVKNGDESDVDCGGTCPMRCKVDDSCNAHADCDTNSCGMVAECAIASCAPTCLEATCDDSRQNGDETAVDCGGSCNPCGVGVACSTNTDCTSQLCGADGTCQPGGPGAPCTEPTECASGHCSDNSLCELGYAGDSCGGNADCASDVCTGEFLCDEGSFGQECQEDADCLSNHCDGTCQTGGAGTECRGPEDCLTAVCTDNRCAPEAYVIKTNGDKGTDGRLFFAAKVTTPKPIAWDNLAFLYYFSEATNADFDGYSYEAPGGVQAAAGLLLELQPDRWVLVWRSTSTADSMAGGEASIDYQLAQRGENFENRRDDYSYLAGADTVNPKVVVCQRDGARFKRVAGTPAPFITNDPCTDAAESCDGLDNCKEPVRVY